MIVSHSAAERIQKYEDTEDSRLAAAMATAILAHKRANEPTGCKHVRRVLEDEDGVIIQTVCWVEKESQ